MQRGKHAACGLHRVQAFLDVALQDSVGADFHKNAATLGSRLGHGIGKAHRLAHVAPPVIGIQLRSGQRSTRDGGNELRLGGLCRGQPLQTPGQIAPGTVHVVAVESVVQIEQAKKHLLRCQQRLQTLQVLQAAGQGDVGRAVDAGDFDIGTGAQSGDGFFSRRGRHADGSHAPLATGQVLRLATGADDGNGLLQTQGSTGPGSSNLANAVPQDRSGLHALLLKQSGNGHLHGKQQRLGHSSVLQAGMCGIDLQLLQQGKTGLGLHGGI